MDSANEGAAITSSMKNDQEWPDIRHAHRERKAWSTHLGSESPSPLLAEEDAVLDADGTDPDPNAGTLA